jgi:hypothetical protein
MRRIDQVKSRKIKHVKHIEFLDKKRIKIVFPNDDYIVLLASSIDYGYDAVIYIEKDTI